ncbi:VOC family protein [Halobellus rufus]|uniref:VOC family protein n=1 Tax=Halobellus rufus TaxID=1448860 RepID=UPI0018CCF3B5|nr:VOC family protein [Halobellus rufus]
MDGTIDHVVLHVRNVYKSAQWYIENMEYENKKESIDHSSNGELTSIFLGPQNTNKEVVNLRLKNRNKSDELSVKRSRKHIAVRVPEGELNDYYHQLIQNGVTNYRDPESCDNRFAFVKDPDGHEIQIVESDQSPVWSIDHIMMPVTDPDRSLGFWIRNFDYYLKNRVELDSFSAYFVKPRGSTSEAASIELIYEPDLQLQEENNLWGHVSIRVDDLLKDWENLMNRGAPDLRKPKDSELSSALTATPTGHEIELIANW